MHSSNLYEDGQMPFMQRITWTGIALHAGTLPGHPASHGCIRLPIDFAQRLFDLTDLGMRVLVVREDMGPSEIDHPRLFKSNPVRQELAATVPSSDRSLVSNTAPGARLAAASEAGVTPGSARHLQILQANAAAKAAAAEAASKSEREARQAAATKVAAAASAARSLRAAESNVAKADTALKQADRRLETASSPQVKQQAETAKAKLAARIDELQAQLQTVRLQEQASREAAEQATEAARAATAIRDSAAQAAEEAARKTLPVSVFISRKTQRLYVRKGNYPIYEGPLAIRDPQAPIGTFCLWPSIMSARQARCAGTWLPCPKSNPDSPVSPGAAAPGRCPRCQRGCDRCGGRQGRPRSRCLLAGGARSHLRSRLAEFVPHHFG